MRKETIDFKTFVSGEYKNPMKREEEKLENMNIVETLSGFWVLGVLLFIVNIGAKINDYVPVSFFDLRGVLVGLPLGGM